MSLAHVYLCLCFAFVLFASVDSAPKSSLKKRLQETEAASEGATSAASSADGAARGSGSRQRLEQLESLGNDHDQIGGHLRAKLKSDWASGEVSALKVQGYSHAAAKDGAYGLDDLSKNGHLW